MNPWAPTIVVAVITALGWAVTYGTLIAGQNRNTIDIAKVNQSLDDHKKEIWPRVTTLEANVAVLNDRTGKHMAKGATS